MNSNLQRVVAALVLLLLLILGFRCMRSGPAANANLIVNGDAEAGPGSPDGNKDTGAPGWKTVGNFRVVQYGATNGYPAASVPGPADRGKNFFAGGPNGDESSATQTIDVSGHAGAIDSGALFCRLSGYLGGYESQDDNAALVAQFQGGDSSKLGSVAIGPILAADRGRTTGFYLRRSSAPVPAGTRKIVVALTMRRTEGTSNDGYADSLSLVLSRERE